MQNRQSGAEKKHSGLFGRVADSILSILILYLTLRCVIHLNGALTSTEGVEVLLAILFLIIAVEYVLRFLRGRRTPEGCGAAMPVYAAASMCCGGVLLVMGYSMRSANIAGILYGLALAASRVLAILRKPGRRGVMLNVGLLLLLVGAMVVADKRLNLCLLLIIAQSLLHILSLSFSHVDLRTLRKVIVKSYAAEVLFGMLLLIVAFSTILPTLESGIETFGDALWYCFAVVTTIGFGDLAAAGTVGRILSVILGVYGIIVVSLITSVIVNFYIEVRNNPADAEETEAETEIS